MSVEWDVPQERITWNDAMSWDASRDIVPLSGDAGVPDDGCRRQPRCLSPNCGDRCGFARMSRSLYESEHRAALRERTQEYSCLQVGDVAHDRHHIVRSWSDVPLTCPGWRPGPGHGWDTGPGDRLPLSRTMYRGLTPQQVLDDRMSQGRTEGVPCTAWVVWEENVDGVSVVDSGASWDTRPTDRADG